VTSEGKVAIALATLAGIAMLVRAMRPKSEPTHTPEEPVLDPNPPAPPEGWSLLLNSEVTPELTTKALEFLRSTAPIGSMNPFELNGQQFGAFITRHIKNSQIVRAVELFRPLVRA
jgi:hypothetical protein